MKRASIAILSILVVGCAENTYYACRDDGGSREFCSGLRGEPTRTVLSSQGAFLAPAIRTVSLGPVVH